MGHGTASEDMFATSYVLRESRVGKAYSDLRLRSMERLIRLRWIGLHRPQIYGTSLCTLRLTCGQAFETLAIHRSTLGTALALCIPNAPIRHTCGAILLIRRCRRSWVNVRAFIL